MKAPGTRIILTIAALLSLVGTMTQQTISGGARKDLTFTFANNVSKTAGNYTGSATFSPFGNVTMLP
jgi:hypothetical protein